MASSSKDETIIIWNLGKIKQSSNPSDAILHVLKDHEHVIDCIRWAPYEACVILNKHSQKFFQLPNGTSSESSTNGHNTEDGSPSQGHEEEKIEEVLTAS
jgi:WD40 repeat protein